jgi:hypothetical protein
MRRMGPQFRQLALLSLLGSGTLVCTLYMAYERYYEDVDHGAFVKSVKGTSLLNLPLVGSIPKLSLGLPTIKLDQLLYGVDDSEKKTSKSEKRNTEGIKEQCK